MNHLELDNASTRAKVSQDMTLLVERIAPRVDRAALDQRITLAQWMLASSSTYPFGDYVASRPDEVVRVHRTSGTTGKTPQLANSRRDVDLITHVGGRSQFAARLRPGDRGVHCLNYCMWTGGLTDHMTLEDAGASAVQSDCQRLVMSAWGRVWGFIGLRY
jgi:hypothetical protein